MIDLCKLFGVEEGEEFTLCGADLDYVNGIDGLKKYKIINNTLKYKYPHFNDWDDTCIEINEIKNCNITKLPKKKEFTDDELCILRNTDKEYKWIGRDKYRNVLYMYIEKPEKTKDGNWYGDDWYRIGIYNHLFNSIKWEDEEPVYIDDYVERGVE